MSQIKPSLHLEGLEAREMMAGDVLAYVSGGHLFVTEAVGEANQGQAVAISQLADGRLRVKGTYSQDGGYSLVNGAAYRDFRVTGDLKVTLGLGNDTVQLVRNTAIKGIDINTSSTAFVARPDNDQVFVDGIRTANGLTIKTGRGADLVHVSDSVIGDTGGVYDSLNIHTGTGADAVYVYTTDRGMQVKGHLFVSTYAGAEADRDYVQMRGVTAGRHVVAQTGAGDDTVDLTDVWSGTDVLVSTGAGQDAVKLREVRSLDDFWVYLDAGNDSLDMQYLNADELTLDGGAGIDSLSRSIEGQSRLETVTGFEPTFVWNQNLHFAIMA